MITKGLANELDHISSFFKCRVKASFQYLDKTITCDVFGRYISIYYRNELIWRECLDDSIGNFGIESIQNLFLIIQLIEDGDSSWKDRVYIDDKGNLFDTYEKSYNEFKKDLLSAN
jgi:hypothetical protein